MTLTSKRFTVAFIALVVFVGGFFAVSNNMAQAVPIPEEINLWLDALILTLVTAGLTWVFQYIGLDLRGLATPLAGAFSTWFLLELQNLINLIPPAFDGYVTFVFQVLLILLGSIGTLNLLAMFRSSRKLLPK